MAAVKRLRETASDREPVFVGGAASMAQAFDAVDVVRRVLHTLEQQYVVVSMLPAPEHAPLLAECVARRAHFACSSYVSDAVLAQMPAAERAGIVVLTEAGLDPGIDLLFAHSLVARARAAVGAETAGRDLAALAAEHDLTLWETFMTDLAGHGRWGWTASEALTRLDGLLAGLLAARPDDLTILLTSDHGNLEAAASRSHTANPVPLVALGPEASAFADLDRLDGFEPARRLDGLDHAASLHGGCRQRRHGIGAVPTVISRHPRGHQYQPPDRDSESSAHDPLSS